MRQCKQIAVLNKTVMNEENIIKDYPRWFIQRKSNTGYSFNNLYNKTDIPREYNLTIYETTVKFYSDNRYVYTFLDKYHMRVQYSPIIQRKTPPESYSKLIFGGIAKGYEDDNINAKAWCFDGMFDGNFDRWRDYDIDAHEKLGALQYAKEIIFPYPPDRVLSMNEMFRNLPELEYIDLSNWIIPPWCLEDINFHPFVNCPKLKRVKINDSHITNAHLMRWLEYNFGNCNNRSIIDGDTIKVYNSHKYVFNTRLEAVETYKEYENCYSKELVKYGIPSMDMNEMANWYRTMESIHYGQRLGFISRTILPTKGHPYYDEQLCRVIYPEGITHNKYEILRNNAYDVYRLEWNYAEYFAYSDIHADWTRNEFSSLNYRKSKIPEIYNENIMQGIRRNDPEIVRMIRGL